MTLDERVERAKRLLAEKQAQKAKEADEVSNFYFHPSISRFNLFLFFFAERENFRDGTTRIRKKYGRNEKETRRR